MHRTGGIASILLMACSTGFEDLLHDGGSTAFDPSSVDRGNTLPTDAGDSQWGGRPFHGYLVEALVSEPDLDEALRQAMSEDELVGLSFAISVDNELRYLTGLGDADREAGTPVDPRTSRFRWASVSKGLVGLVALHRHIHGALDFNIDYQEIAPGLGYPTAYLPTGCHDAACSLPLPLTHPAISLRRLLDHTAGVQHYSNGLENPAPSSDLTNDPEVNTGMAWALSRFLTQPLISLPGQRWSYSSFGYNLAGVILEENQGQGLASQVDELIAEPLGLTSLGPDVHWHDRADRVRGYRRDRQGIRWNGDDDVSWKLAAGGFQSTPLDFAGWCAGLLGDTLLDDRTKRDILWKSEDPARAYAFGFEVTRDRQGVIDSVGHGGAQQSVRTALKAYPNEGLCFTLMTNSTWADAPGLLRRFEQIWREAQE